MELLEQGQLRRWPSTYGDGSDLQLPDTPRKPLQGRWSREWLAAGSAWMLDRMRQIDRAAALPSVERLALLERIQRVRPRNRNWMLLGMPPDPSEVLSPFIPSVLRIAQAAGRVETRARLIQSAAAVLTWHDSHGTWPPDLASAGVSPVDPETRLAMHYFGGPEGFVLTAVLPARLQTAGSAGGDPIEFRFGRGQAR